MKKLFGILKLKKDEEELKEPAHQPEDVQEDNEGASTKDKESTSDE